MFWRVFLSRVAVFVITSFAHEARVLMNNAAVIGGTFGELASSFITCFAFSRMSNLTQAHRIAEFVMPTTQSATYLAQSLLEVAHPRLRNETTDVTDNAAAKGLMAMRLQEKLTAIERARC